MSDPATRPAPTAPMEVKANLERAHHEICTALTVLRSNVELVRVELRGQVHPEHTVAVQEHLSELDLAVDRLRVLAVEMRTWHVVGAPDPRAEDASSHGARLLP